MRILLLCFLLAGCGASPLNLLTGGGPNVAANVQAGQTNSQTVGTTNNVSQKLVRPVAREIRQSNDTSRVKSDRVETVTMNEGLNHWWLIGILLWSLLLWELPRPAQMGAWINKKVFRRG